MRAQTMPAVNFSILGPLVACYESEALALGGERQRALLAVLLVHRRELVSTERLIEQAFDGNGSASGVNALHVAVSRLRRTLHVDGREMLLTARRIRPGAGARAARRGDLRALPPGRPAPSRAREPGGRVGAAARGAGVMAWPAVRGPARRGGRAA